MYAIIHKKIDALVEIIPKWEILKGNFREITVFQDIGWLKSWWEYKKKDEEIVPYIVEVREENKTIGIIPLYISLEKIIGLYFRVLKPIGSELTDYLIPILSKDYPPDKLLGKALEKIYEDKKNWDYVYWGEIPEDSTFDSMFNNPLYKENSFSMRIRGEICPFLVLNNDTKKIEEKFSKKHLKTVQYRERKLRKEGELKYCKVKNESEIEPVMNKFFELHHERWKNTATPSAFGDAKKREFALLAAKNLFKSNLLYLAYLSLDNEIIVAHFGMSDGKNNYLYLHAMDINYRKYSIGNIFTYHLILDSCKESYEKVDFLRGDEGYKKLWGTSEKYNVEYYYFNKSIKSRFCKLIHHAYIVKNDKKPFIGKQLILKSFIRGMAVIFNTGSRFNVLFKNNL